MTLVTGTVQDLGYDGMDGTLWARPARFRSDGSVVYAPERKPFKITGGVVSAELAPGPAVLELQVGSHARGTFEVVIPDMDISLADLLDTVFPWEPEQVSLFVAERLAAEAAAGTATAAAGSAAASALQTGQDRTAVAQDRVAVEDTRDLLDAAYDQSQAGMTLPPRLMESALNATYGTKIGGDAPPGGWHLDTSVPPPPLIPGILAASGVTSTAFTLTASGVSGDLHATPYSFSIDDGTTWTAWQAEPTYEVSGRTPDTSYVCRHRVRAADGTVADGYLLTVKTNALTFGVLTSDSFTVDAPNLIGQPTDAALGGVVKTWQSGGTAALLAKVGGSLVRGPDGPSLFVALPNDTADQSLTVQFDQLPTSGALHMTLRRNGLAGLDSIRLFVTPNFVQLTETTEGNPTRDIGSPIPLSGPCELELRAEGTTVTVLKDGTQVLQDSSTTVATPGFTGFANSSSNPAAGFSIGHIILQNKN